METNNLNTEKTYLIPSKSNILFKAECDYFGYIETNVYKDMFCGCCSSTFGTSFENSVNDLHEWIKENSWVVKEYPKAKFNLYAIDGKLDKYGDSIQKKVYTISSAKAKKYFNL